MPLKPSGWLDDAPDTPTRQFTGRGDCFELVDRAIAALDGGYRVLNFYGVGGVGKSRLCTEIGGFLDRMDERRPAWGLVDLEEKALRESPSATLFQMRQQLRRRYGFGFPTFDIAYAVYWQKLHGQTSLARPELPLLDEGDLLAEIVDVVEEVPGVGLVTKIPKLIHKASRRAQEWWVQRGQRSLARLPELKGFEIEKRLPAYWALDLKTQAQDRPVVLILDTYEALWTHHSSVGGWTRVDEWVRDWVLELPGVLWVVAGRERLSWHESDPDWAPVVELRTLEALPDGEAGEFLRSCGIVDPGIVDTILRVTQGNPFYLDLAADTYEDVAELRPPQPEDFGRTPFELVERFTRYLSDPQLGTLEVLAVPNGWDPELFALLVKRFDTGLPTQHHPRLARYSFIQRETAASRWYMHALMRQALLEHPRFADPAQVHSFLFEHFRARLEGVPRSTTRPEHVEALREALYHGQRVLGAEELSSWLLESADAFDHWEYALSLLPLYQQILQLEGDAGREDSIGSADLHRRLGMCLAPCERYAEAEEAYRATLRIRQLRLAPDDPAIGQAYLDLGRLLRTLDRLEEAKEYAREAERVYVVDQAGKAAAAGTPSEGFPHEGLSDALRLLASIFEQEYRYPEARDLYERALALSPPEQETDRAYLRISLASTLNFLEREPERVLELVREAVAVLEGHYGPRSVRAASARSHLASALYGQGRYAEAEILVLDSLEILREWWGEDSSATANLLWMLAMVRSGSGSSSRDAHSLVETAFSTTRAAFGEQHSSTALISLYLANRFERPDEVRERAIPLLLRAWETLRTLYGASHPQAVFAQADLAEAYRKIGEYGEADRLLSDAAALCTDRGSSYLLAEGVVRLNWSEVKRHLLQNAEAEADLLRAVCIFEGLLPSSRLGLANCLRRLAMLHAHTTRLVEAERKLRRAYALEEEIYGPDHPGVVETLLGIASIQRQMREHPAALDTIERVLSILRNSGRAEEFQALEAQLDKGRLLGDLGRHKEGIEILRRTGAEIEERYPHLAGTILQTRRQLGILLSGAGAVGEARAILSGVLDQAVAGSRTDPGLAVGAAFIYEDLLKLGGGQDDGDEALLRRGGAIAERVGDVAPYAAAYIHLVVGEHLFSQERLAEAEVALRASYERGPTTQNLDLRIRPPLMLAWCMGRMGRFEGVEPLLVDALDTAREAFGPHSPAGVKACHLLAEYHANQGNHAEALHFAALFLEMGQAALGPDNPLLAKALLLDASVRSAANGPSPEMEAQLRRACSIFAKSQGDDPRDYADALTRLAQQLTAQQRTGEAVAILRQALDLVEGRPDSEGHRALALAALGCAYASDSVSEHFEKAEPLLREAERRGRATGADITSEPIWEAIEGLAGVLYQGKRYAELDTHLGRVIEEMECTPKAGSSSHQHLVMLWCYARVEQGSLDAAGEALEHFLQFEAYDLGDDAGSIVLNTALKVINPLAAAGRTKRVRALADLLERAVGRTSGLPPEVRQVLLVTRAKAAIAEEDLEETEEILDRYFDLLGQTGGRPIEGGIQAVEGVAARLHAKGEHAHAARRWEQAWELRKERYPEFQYTTALAAMNFGVALLWLREWERARAVLTEALEGHTFTLEMPDLTAGDREVVTGRIGEILLHLGRVEYHTGAYSAALERLQESLKLVEELHGGDDPRTHTVTSAIAQVRQSLRS